MKLNSPRVVRVLVAVSLLAFGASGCGGDEPPPKKSKGGAKKATKKKGKRKGKKGVSRYAKVDDSLRYKFSDSDFRPDPKGDLNRDPFQSFVVRQPDDNENKDGGNAADICPADKWMASKYPLRSLKLIGIIQGGKKSYALFRDASGFGHIVKRTFCLGKEKAIIDDIGVGLVRLEVAAETTQGTTAAPQMRTIALYPEETVLDPTSQDEPSDEGDKPEAPTR